MRVEAIPSGWLVHTREHGLEFDTWYQDERVVLEVLEDLGCV